MRRTARPVIVARARLHPVEVPSVPRPGDRRRIRVGLVDDHPALLAGLADALRRAPDIELVGTAGDVDVAVDLAAAVEVLVCDIQLAGHAEGLQLLDAVHRRAAPPAVLMLSAFDGPSMVRAVIDRGAAGFLDKGADLATIVEAIRTVAAGGTAFSAARLRAARTARRRPSDRELEVIALVVAGATNAEAGRALGLTEKTVESHLRRLFDRYGLLSRTELAVLAIGEGWVAGPPAG